MFKAFQEVAKAGENYEFFHAPAECASEHGAEHHSVTVIRNFDESPVQYKGGANQELIEKFMESQSIPTLINFSEDYIEPIFGAGRTAAILFTNEQETPASIVWS